METFNKLTSMLLHALETREPTVDLLDSFIDHWKSITNYYIETTDDNRPVKQTDIPWRLRQMLDILVYEDKQQAPEDTGPCLEYLLQHKLLETLSTLGKAQYPPGMLQQVLLFFSKFLSQMQKPLLHLVNIYRPVQKLIRLCALPGSHTEKDEAQFLLVVCSRVKQDPHALRYVLEILDQPAVMMAASDQSQSSTQASNHRPQPPQCCSQSHPSADSPVQSESVLLSALLQLSRSQRAPVRLKACEALLLLVELQATGELLSRHTQLGELLTGRLLELYALLPLEDLDPLELQNWTHTAWSAQFSGCSSDAPDHMTNFFCWLDFLDHLMRAGPQVLSEVLALCVHQRFLLKVLHPQLLHTCEQVVLASTSVLCAAVRLVRSWSLLDRLVHFLLRTDALAQLLMRRCDHISDQISLVSLSLVDELLQKPHGDVLDVLVLTFLQSRSYLSSPAAGQEDRPETSEDNEDLEEDPFFSDDVLPPRPPASRPGSADVVNSFLCLVPVQVRSAQLLQEGGYESYVHDAHTLVTQCQQLSLSWDWPLSLPCSAPRSGEEVHFFEGHLLKVLFDRLGRILEQPYEVNLQLTAVLSRLSSFSHPLLHEYLLNPYIHLSPCCRSLFSVLIRLIGQVMQRIQQVSHLSDRLLDTRRHLLGLKQETGLEHLTLLRGVVVLEEFCKELAAIAFVKLDQNQDHLDQDHLDQNHLDQNHLDQNHLDQDQDQDHLDQNHQDQDHLDQDHLDQDQDHLDQDHLDHLDQNHLDQDHLDQDQDHQDQDRLDQDHLDQDHQDQDHLDQDHLDNLDQDHLNQDRLDHLDQDRLDHLDQNHLDQDHLNQDRLDRLDHLDQNHQDHLDQDHLDQDQDHLDQD